MSWDRNYTMDDLEDFIEEKGKLPIVVQDEEHIGLYLVDMGPTSKLKSLDDRERTVALVHTIMVAGKMLRGDDR